MHRPPRDSVFGELIRILDASFPAGRGNASGDIFIEGDGAQARKSVIIGNSLTEASGTRIIGVGYSYGG